MNIATELARAILDMEDEILQLRSERNHYKALYEMHAENTRQTLHSQEGMMASILVAAIDPDSRLNKLLKTK